MASFCLEKSTRGKMLHVIRWNLNTSILSIKLQQKYVLIEIFERESIRIPAKENCLYKKNANRDGDMYFWDLLCW